MRHMLGTIGAGLAVMGMGEASALHGHIRRRRGNRSDNKASMWPHHHARLDLDFANARGYMFGRGQADPTTMFTTTCTSARWFTNAAGVLTQAAANTPVIGYNMSTLECLGLLNEEQRTNGIRNNTMQGASAGAPGTSPTNWTIPGSGNGLTNTKGLPGQINGVDGIDVRYVGTATSANIIISTETLSGIAAAPGDVWTPSAFLALAAGSWANVSQVILRVVWLDAAQATITTSSSSNLLNQTIDGTLRRYESAPLTAPANTAFVRPQVMVVFSSGAVLDFTLRIGLPQCEKGAGATSPIKTTSAAVTRTACTSILSGAAFDAMAGGRNGWTIYTEHYNRSADYGAGIWSLDDGTSNNMLALRYNAGGTANNLEAYAAGVQQGSSLSDSTQLAATTLYRNACSFNRFRFRRCPGGGSVSESNAPALEGVFKQLNIGGSTGNPLNGWIRRIIVLPYEAPEFTLPGFTP